MQVILLERVENLGAMGDVVTVKNGFARNYLLPQDKALRATDANKARFEREREILEKRNAERRDLAAKSGEGVDGSIHVLIRQAGENGQLYGSVTSRDVADAVSTDALSVARSQVVLDTPIKTLGLHEVRVRLHPEVVVTVTINVARTADEAERQARGEDVIATAADEDRAIAEAQAAALFEAGAEPDEFSDEDGGGSEASDEDEDEDETKAE